MYFKLIFEEYYDNNQFENLNWIYYLQYRLIFFVIHAEYILYEKYNGFLTIFSELFVFLQISIIF